ncbi:hypothetical protein cyc_08409 [Cyclospora cayetanensis]|uniref:Uncharacterized protein n=1 Tax=Cyclospora cayetanensis TaxID=88456 RepID=A0A1D3D0Y2_9EIME|nr:hypothetical protein cyc_08409 [Cyclospora cayetanensis]
MDPTTPPEKAPTRGSPPSSLRSSASGSGCLSASSVCSLYASLSRHSSLLQAAFSKSSSTELQKNLRLDGALLDVITPNDTYVGSRQQLHAWLCAEPRTPKPKSPTQSPGPLGNLATAPPQLEGFRLLRDGHISLSTDHDGVLMVQVGTVQKEA